MLKELIQKIENLEQIISKQDYKVTRIGAKDNEVYKDSIYFNLMPASYQKLMEK